MHRPSIPPLPPLLYQDAVRAALAEDLGRAGDLTSDAIVPAELGARGEIRARREGRICGVEIAAAAFRLLDPAAEIEIRVADGCDVEEDVYPKGGTLLTVAGRARALLAAERVALNFLGHLSGIATTTRDVVRRIDGTGARVVCTRKTTPNLRALEKYAVRCGGGANHRFGLDDAVLIKDNHRALAGSAAEAVRRAREAVGHLVAIEIEIDELDDLEPVLDAGAQAVLLDNMPPETLRRAVAINRGRAALEASGGITPDTARAVAETGVDLLSIGWLTHSAPSLDVGFDLDLDRSSG